jgi:hypothetical protein
MAKKSKTLKAICWCGKEYTIRVGRPADPCPECQAKNKANRASSHWTGKHRRGYREIGGKKLYFPNKMMANYYRYLLWLKEKGEISDFEYEGQFPRDEFTFDFRPFGVTRGCVTYRPDFAVRDKLTDVRYRFKELTGRMRSDHRTKLNRMKKFYPRVIVDVVTYQDYQTIARQVGKIIQGWE